MPLLTGTWIIVLHGYAGSLNIQSIGQGGTVNFLLTVPALNLGLPSEVRNGFWDESSQSITLQIITVQTAVGQREVLTLEGCQFQIPPIAAPGKDVEWNLAGTLTAFGSLAFASTARRYRFGWYAKIEQSL